VRTIIEEFTEMIKAVSDRSTNLMEARFFEYNIPNAKRKLERARTKLQDAIVDLQTTNERAEARIKELEAQLSAASHALAKTDPWVNTDHFGAFFCMHCGKPLHHVQQYTDHTHDCVWVQAVNHVAREEQEGKI
jgi:hypothetical protein